MSKTYEGLQPHLEKAVALQMAMVLFEWSNEALTPKEAGAYTSKVIGTLSEKYLEKTACDEVKRLIAECKEDKTLSEVEAAVVREAVDELGKLEYIPSKEYREFAQLSAESTGIWAEARKNKDFEAFAPTLQKVVNYQKRFVSCRAKDGQKLYDVMLDIYRRGFNMKVLDEFFRQLKDTIVPLLKEIMKHGRKIDDSFLTGDYSVEKQEEIAKYLVGCMGSDFDKGVLAVNAHPFTINPHNHDVRITTAYNEHVDDSIFSVVHEASRGIYELGIRGELTQTMMGQGTSIGTHRSQSRFFGNIIGRSRVFWVPVYGKLQELFPEQLGDIDLDTFINAISRVQSSLIRTQADELTYSLHAMVRYKIGKMLVEENLEVEKLSNVRADKYKGYLDVRPKDASEGVLQDIHWSQGSFGYFPSYVLGNAFGTQLYARMRKKMDLGGLLEEGKTDVIREYLKNRIHRFGKLKTSQKMLKDVTGEDFSPKYYIGYLTGKHRKIYEL